ncbi:MAG: HEPN domain-containing protein [Candidatus Brockarchaeota archaeon]|nr:HEPN domain-containing protein [Candidatus Brockarchaeota archaeon]
MEKEDSILLLTKLEDAYVGARYLPRRYEEVEVKALLRFVKEVFKPIVDGV